MALIDQKTDLKNLKYSDFNNRGPFVVDDINKQPESRNQLRIEGEARRDDINRLSQLLATNLKFSTNQALLNAQSIASKLRSKRGIEDPVRRRKEIGKVLIESLSNIGQAINTQIAQAGVAGTGLHFISNFKTEDTTYLGKFGGPLSLTGTRITVSRPGSLENRFYDRFSGNTINYTDVKTEKITSLDDDQIIPFEIAIYDPKKPLKEKATEYLYFTAYINSLNDRYSGAWNATSYIGRGEPLFNYNDFSRGIEFDFRIAAESKFELQPLYNKLNRLVGTTAPSYSESGVFKRGVFTKLTIGDLFKQIPGFFTSVNLTWNADYPWEIGRDEEGQFDNNLQRVPHVLDITVSFQPVHSFIPEYGKNFLLNI